MKRLITRFFQYGTGYSALGVLRMFTRLDIRGAEQLRSLSGPLLIVANHNSYWDPLIIGSLFLSYPPRYLPIGFMAADHLFTNIFFRLGFALTGTVPAYKGRGLDVSLKYPRAVLSRDGIVLLFPFGGLTIDSTYPRPGRGAATLIQERENMAIVPIWVHTTPTMTIRDFLFGRKKMEIRVGKPFTVPDAKNKNVDDITKLLIEQIFSAGCDPPALD